MGELVSLTAADGHRLSAYRTGPGDAACGLVVIQEIFGVNAVMRAIADKFAAAGFLAICPDLFWRIEPGIDITDGSEAEWKRAFELYNAFDVDIGVRDLAATIAASRSHAACSGKVGSVGFCLGGLLAYLTATRTDVDAAVGYYGVGIERFTAEADGMTTTLVLHIAEEDQFVPKEAQTDIVAKLGSRPGVELYKYPGQDHAFARMGGEHYNAEAADLAWTRTLSLFNRAL